MNRPGLKSNYGFMLHITQLENFITNETQLENFITNEIQGFYNVKDF